MNNTGSGSIILTLEKMRRGETPNLHPLNNITAGLSVCCCMVYNGNIRKNDFLTLINIIALMTIKETDKQKHSHTGNAAGANAVIIIGLA